MLKSTCNQNYLSIFIQKNILGFLKDHGITLIDKTDDLNPTRQEEYWCAMLKTVAPYRVNMIE